MMAEIDPARIEAIITNLVSFDPLRGIGAARDWIASEMQSFASTSGRRMTVTVAVSRDARLGLSPGMIRGLGPEQPTCDPSSKITQQGFAIQIPAPQYQVPLAPNHWSEPRFLTSLPVCPNLGKISEKTDFIWISFSGALGVITASSLL
ncbi:hypothetical protein B0H11DRAFT_1942354 [Mycena galericulata]|nr:hypothetical protein B0H11DRAFT_1942354 [Mycena galericulata]